MKLLALGPLPVLLALAAPSPLFDGTRLEHTVEEDRTIELTFTAEHEGAVVSWAWFPLEDGEPVEDEAEEYEDTYADTHTFEVVIVDHYVGVEDNVVTELHRTFESMEGEYEVEYEAYDYDTEEPETVTEGGPLVLPFTGRTLIFTLEDEEYTAAFSEDDDKETEFDEALLEGALIDAYGDYFLPEDAVEVGDEWELEWTAWLALIRFGGDFWLAPEDMETPTEEEIEMRQAERAKEDDSGSGKLTCTLVELKEVDGEMMAVIEITGEIETTVTSEESSDEEDEYGDVYQFYAESTIESTGTFEATCTWRVEAGFPESIRAKIVATNETTTDETYDDGDDTYTTRTVEIEETTDELLWTFELR